MYLMTRRESDRILARELQELAEDDAELLRLEEEGESQAMAADEAA